MNVALPHRALASAALAVAASSCTYYDGYQGGPPPLPVHYEREPNDAACCPDPVGTLAVGDAFAIHGHVEDFGFDLFDGFAFQTLEPLDVEFVLAPRYGESADLDLHVYDPYLGAYVLAFDSYSSVETGRFTVPAGATDFHLVVTSFFGTASYRLEISIWPATFAAMASDPRAADAKTGRAMPLERYFRAVEPPDDDREPARAGFVLVIDEDTAEVHRYAIEARVGSELAGAPPIPGRIPPTSREGLP